MIRSVVGAVVAAALLSVAAVSALTPKAPVQAAQAALIPAPCPAGPWEPDDVPLAPREDARNYSGTHSGGYYKIEIPEKWNGELVLWAHGRVNEAGPNGRKLRAQPPRLRDHLIRNGFAWAASSYRCNGYVAGAGMLDTLDLIDLFTRTNGGKAPVRTYLTGASMGGHATLLAMHLAPERVDGALALCHSASDIYTYFDHLTRSAVALAGLSPTRETLETDVDKLLAAMGQPPDYTEAGRRSASQQIEWGGGPRPFAVEGLAPQFVSNLERGLRLMFRPARQKRFDDEPFTGRLTKPVLTLHTTGDMLVPIHLQRTLRQAVNKAGRDQFLVQRIIRAPGHCTYSPEESSAAFDDLVTWVRTGKRPDGDDVMADLRDAGRKFTNPIRPGDPGGLVVK